jgi:hypothetical protein
MSQMNADLGAANAALEAYVTTRLGAVDSITVFPRRVPRQGAR